MRQEGIDSNEVSVPGGLGQRRLTPEILHVRRSAALEQRNQAAVIRL